MDARLDKALAHWQYVAPLLSPPVNDAEYRARVKDLDAILDAGGADETHPLAALAALASMLGERIAEYEALRYPMPEALNALDGIAGL